MPATMNRKKGAGIGQRQIALAKEGNAAGLSSDAGANPVATEIGC
jgi:hypothetical protein